MKKNTCLLFPLLMISIFVMAQPVQNTWEPGKAHSNMVSGGFVFPIGEFSETHFAGFGFAYSWSRHRFGKWFPKTSHRTGFIASAGIDHYFGKKDQFGFRYFGLTYVHAMAGVVYTPGVNGNIGLQAGPALSIYKGDHRTGFETRICGHYFLENNFAFTYSVQYMNHHHENARWIFGLGAGYCF
jgi:hypothetical protein